MTQSAEDRIAAFTQAVDQARKDVDRLDLMQEEIKAIEGVETSADRSVTVTAGAQGSLRSIKITDAAMAKSAQTLSQVVTRTFQLAVAKAARQQAEIVQRYAGANSKIVEKVGKLQEELLNPKITHGFQLHHDNAADEGSVLVTSDRPTPPRPPAPSYPAPLYPAQSYSAPNAGQPTPPHYPPPSPPASAPKRRAADSYDDYDSAPGVLTDGSATRSRPSSPPPAARQGDADVFRFGEEDY